MGGRTDTDVGRALQAIAAPSMRYHSFSEIVSRRPAMTSFTLLQAALPEVRSAAVDPSSTSEIERPGPVFPPPAPRQSPPTQSELRAPMGEQTTKPAKAPVARATTVAASPQNVTALDAVFGLLRGHRVEAHSSEPANGLRGLLSSL
jgi:hypothetical protein